MRHGDAERRQIRRGGPLRQHVFALGQGRGILCLGQHIGGAEFKKGGVIGERLERPGAALNRCVAGNAGFGEMREGVAMGQRVGVIEKRLLLPFLDKRQLALLRCHHGGFGHERVDRHTVDFRRGVETFDCGDIAAQFQRLGRDIDRVGDAAIIGDEGA